VSRPSRVFLLAAARARTLALTLAGWPTQIPSSQQMHVKMEHGLAGTRPYIQHCSISIFDTALPCHSRRRQMAQAKNLYVFSSRFFQAVNVFFRNNQYVRWRFGIDVFEGESVLIFVDFFRGDFTGNDAAEQAVFHGSPIWGFLIEDFGFQIQDCRFSGCLKASLVNPIFFAHFPSSLRPLRFKLLKLFNRKGRKGNRTNQRIAEIQASNGSI
jgi:hypothetical protein